MKTLTKKIIKKTYSILKKELDEFYSDLICILREVISAIKKFLTSEPLFIVGVLIGMILCII